MGQGCLSQSDRLLYDRLFDPGPGTEGSDLGYSIVYDESLFSYEQAGGIDTYWWKAQEPGKPNCYLSVSRLTGYTLDEAMEGLILQSGLRERVLPLCWMGR